MLLALRFVLLIQLEYLLVHHKVQVHRLCLGCLYCLVKPRCDCLVSGLSIICLSKSSGNLGLRSFLGPSEIPGPEVELDRRVKRVHGLLYGPQILPDL